MPPSPGFEHITDLFFSPRADGTTDISGSKLTLNVACRNRMKHTGASIVNAFKVGSYNPAKVVGLTDRGQIAVGKRADLIFVGQKMNVEKVLVNGVSFRNDFFLVIVYHSFISSKQTGADIVSTRFGITEALPA